MRKIVEIKNLVKSYGGKDYQTKVLKNINLDIYENDFIAIMGPSGAGKSTLLNMLSTLDKPTRGEIIIDGEDITKVNNKRLSKIRQEKIGFIFQDYNLFSPGYRSGSNFRPLPQTRIPPMASLLPLIYLEEE